MIRGVPGSGKTTMARDKYVRKGYLHYEADMLMVKGLDADLNVIDPSAMDVYEFDRSKLKKCHDACFHATKHALEQGRNVVVSNTFIRLWEMQRYLDLPYKVTVVRATGEFINTHGVPEHVVERMRESFEEYRGENDETG